MKKNKTMKELLRSYILSPKDRDYAFQNVDKDKLRKVIEDFPKYLKVFPFIRPTRLLTVSE